MTAHRPRVGWIASAVIFGQLAAALCLPALRIRTIRRPAALSAIAMLLVGLWTTLLGSYAELIAGWLVAGLCFGALQYLGFTAAAASALRTAAFGLRLGVVMVVAGAVAGGLRFVDAFTSYDSTVMYLAAVTGLIAAVGLSFYRPPPTSEIDARGNTGIPPSSGITGLASLLLLFVGQIGFIAYAIQQAAERGLPLGSTALALSAMKVAVGAWLIYGARAATPRVQHMAATAALLSAGILVIGNSSDILPFFVGLLMFEIAFNSLSASLQAKIVEADPDLGRSWLTATILIGAALGPPIHGLVAAFGDDTYFTALALFSTFVPALWARIARRRPATPAAGR